MEADSSAFALQKLELVKPATIWSGSLTYLVHDHRTERQDLPLYNSLRENFASCDGEEH